MKGLLILTGYKEKLSGFWRTLFSPADGLSHRKAAVRGILAALIGGILAALSVALVTAGSFAALPALLADGMGAFAWTALFAALLSLVLGAALNCPPLGYLLPSIVSVGLTVVNHYKMLITAVPLELHELGLAGRLGGIVALNAASIRVTPAVVTALALPIVWAAVLWRMTCRLPKPGGKQRLVSVAGALAAFVLLFGVFADPLLYAPAGVSLKGRAPQAKVYHECFVPLGLWRSVLFRDQRELVDVTDEDALQQLKDSLQGGASSGNSSAPAPDAPGDAPAAPETTVPPASSAETPPASSADPAGDTVPPAEPDPVPPPADPAPSDPEPSVPGGKEEPPANTEQTKPNIILVLAESFFDVTDLPGVTFPKDPLADFHALQAESVSGRFFSRTLGYGTCNIELELFTGINHALLTQGDDPMQWKAEEISVFPTVPEILQENGYSTSLLHMFGDHIYHRRRIFSKLGFDEMYFTDDFTAIDPAAAAAENYTKYMHKKERGDYCSDDYMVDMIISMYEARTDNGPVFLYASSMENHTPYYGEKYNRYTYPFTVEPAISDQAVGALNSYVQGAAAGSKALRRMVDYFSQTEEPTVILFFGDHRPGLGLDAGSVYTELGIYNGYTYSLPPADAADLYAADYLIWANDPALLPAPQGTVRDTSCGFFGLEVLDAAGAALPRYWQMVREMRKESICYNHIYFVDDSGNTCWTDDLPDTVDTAPFVQMASVLADAKGERKLTDWLCQYPE